uniref:Uncharacterized protein n=1 Tax=Rhipicephalus appendiculatus TaxID=34631 RepID=A0A131YFF4_RHIAP
MRFYLAPLSKATIQTQTRPQIPHPGAAIRAQAVPVLTEAPAPSQSPESSPEARGSALPQHLRSSLRPRESQEIVYVLSNPGQQESASNRVAKKPNVKKSKTKKKRQPCQVHGAQRPPSHQRKSSRKEKADRSSTESDEECNLATPFIWTMGMVQKLVQFCSEPPPPPPR